MNRKIGIIFGRENTFPAAVIERINGMRVHGVTAEAIKLGAVKMAEPSGYHVIIDRISHDIPFYRAYLKNAVLTGTIVINNPFWCAADDKFFNYALATKLGVATPRTVILPHRAHPPGTTAQSMLNLIYPLDWDAIFRYIGFPAFLKPHTGFGGKNVYKVHTPDEFFHYYNQTGSMCMALQSAVEFEKYFRCYVIGQENVHVMRYEPGAPSRERYVKNAAPAAPALHKQLVNDALTLCRALGYDLNTVEFAVHAGVPFVIDSLNFAPDADLNSVGKDHFDWVVAAVAEFVVRKALSRHVPAHELRWASFLSGDKAGTPSPSDSHAANTDKRRSGARISR